MRQGKGLFCKFPDKVSAKEFLSFRFLKTGGRGNRPALPGGQTVKTLFFAGLGGFVETVGVTLHDRDGDGRKRAVF